MRIKGGVSREAVCSLEKWKFLDCSQLQRARQTKVSCDFHIEAFNHALRMAHKKLLRKMNETSRLRFQISCLMYRTHIWLRLFPKNNGNGLLTHGLSRSLSYFFTFSETTNSIYTPISPFAFSIL